MDRITLSGTEMMDQAWRTAGSYLTWAKQQIDEEFGKGYAKEHPELVAAFMKTCAQDFSDASMGSILQEGIERIAEAIESLRQSDEERVEALHTRIERHTGG